MSSKPIVMISSWPPRLCGIGTFAEEAVAFLQRAQPRRDIHIISHTDGQGEKVHPVIDMTDPQWYLPVVETVKQLDPEVVHIQHEYGLYNYVNERGESDFNNGFLLMLDMLSDYATIVEPHSIHGRMKDAEEDFVRALANKCSILVFKCSYQKWRLEWTFRNKGWEIPHNIIIIPHGARPDRRYRIDQVDKLKADLGLEQFVGKHIVGLVGWIQNNKAWDILTEMWEDIYHEIRERSGQQWFLFAAGDIRDPNHKRQYEKYVGEVKLLEQEGMAHYFQFIPRGELYYKVLAICDFIVLPSLDETQSGTLARIIALNKPYITTAPLEGLTSQTVDSGGGLLFTTKAGLRRQVLRLANSERLRLELGNNLKKYLEGTVSWEVVTDQYLRAYHLAVSRRRANRNIYVRPEF